MTERLQDVLRARTFLCVAHRGASAYAPENTIDAFTRAVDQGVDAIELDVHLTRDGEVVVMHDDRVDRTTSGTGEISALELRAIQELDAGGWFGAQWQGARVPTLAEVLDQFAERVWIDIEIKAGVRAHWFAGRVAEDTALTQRMAGQVLDLARRYGALDRIVVSSFGPAALKWVRETSARIATQLSVLSAEIADDCAAAAAAGFDVISPQVYAASARNVGPAHAAGLAVHIYAGSDDDDEVMERLLDLGVDGVKTNRPDRLRALLTARAAG